MESLAKALDAIESASGNGSDRPGMGELVQALTARGGDWARIGTVIETLLPGMDALDPGAVDTFVNVAGTVDDPTATDPNVDADNDEPAQATIAQSGSRT
jgi:hypothetical protein